MASYAHPDVVVETAWVHDHLNDPIVRIVEANYNRDAFNSGHLPGASAWTWRDDFQHPIGKDILDKEGMQELLAHSGITNHTTVVCCGALHNAYATYAFCLLN